MIDLATAVGVGGRVPFGAQLSGDGSVVSDIPCRRCGYNLRGLHAGGVCPECGAPIEFSIKGDLLEFSSPEWLDTLARGAKLFIWGIVILIVGSLIAGVASGLARAGGGPLIVVSLFASVLMTVAWWMMTEPDPSGLGEDKYGTARKIIRIGLIASVLDQVLEFVKMGGPHPPVANLMIGIADFLCGVMNLIAFFAGLNYLRKLALRVPDGRLAGQARFLIWAWAILFSVGFAGILSIAVLAASQPNSSIVGLASVVGIVFVITAIVFGIMYLLLMIRMGNAFKYAGIRAKANWIQRKHAEAAPAV